MVLPLPSRQAHVLFIVDSRRCQCTASNFYVSFASGLNYIALGRFDASRVRFSLCLLRGGRRVSRWGIPITHRAEAAMPRAGACQIAHCAEAAMPRAGVCRIAHRAEAAVPCAGASIAHRAEAAVPRAGASK